MQPATQATAAGWTVDDRFAAAVTRHHHIPAPKAAQPLPVVCPAPVPPLPRLWAVAFIAAAGRGVSETPPPDSDARPAKRGPLPEGLSAAQIATADRGDLARFRLEHCRVLLLPGTPLPAPGALLADDPRRGLASALGWSAASGRLAAPVVATFVLEPTPSGGALALPPALSRDRPGPEGMGPVARVAAFPTGTPLEQKCDGIAPYGIGSWRLLSAAVVTTPYGAAPFDDVRRWQESGGQAFPEPPAAAMDPMTLPADGRRSLVLTLLPSASPTPLTLSVARARGPPGALPLLDIRMGGDRALRQRIAAARRTSERRGPPMAEGGGGGESDGAAEHHAVPWQFLQFGPAPCIAGESSAGGREVHLYGHCLGRVVAIDFQTCTAG